MRFPDRVTMPRHLRKGSTWGTVIYVLTGAALFALWVTAIVMVMP
jgi:hypothetical protein